MPARSYLYVPGDDAGKLAKALDRGPDAVIADLEDAVAPASKDAARATVTSWLRERTDGGPQRWVRVNNDDRLDADLDAVVREGLDGVVLPKASVDRLNEVGDGLARRERGAGLSEGAVALFALVETAVGVGEVDAMAAMDGIVCLGFGEADLAADLGIAPDEDQAWAPLRSRLVVACAAAGTPVPVASTATDFRDLDALRASSRRLRRSGFRARTAIHPAQLPVIHEVFTPSDDEVRAAQRTVDRFEAALASGRGVAVDDQGRMIDEAVVRSARRVLASRPSVDR